MNTHTVPCLLGTPYVKGINYLFVFHHFFFLYFKKVYLGKGIRWVTRRRKKKSDVILHFLVSRAQSRITSLRTLLRRLDETSSFGQACAVRKEKSWVRGWSCAGSPSPTCRY